MPVLRVSAAENAKLNHALRLPFCNKEQSCFCQAAICFEYEINIRQALNYKGKGETNCLYALFAKYANDRLLNPF